MIEMISDLFEDSGFFKIRSQDNMYLFSSNNENKSAYWLVVGTENPKQTLERQADLFSQCKKTVPDKSLDKNISLLILWDTGGELDQTDMKQQVMHAEEDPYFFKKYVLYFSDKELSLLKKEQGQTSPHNFLNEKLTLSTTFSEYKNNPTSQESWQPLLYRISIKLPFTSIPTEESRSLDSLFSKNNQVILSHTDKSLAQLDLMLFQQLEALDDGRLTDMNAISLLDNLSASQGKDDDS